MAKKQQPSEHNEQAAFVDYVIWTYRNRADFIRPLFFAVPNGAYMGPRGGFVMNKMKGEGLNPGVSDILYLQARGDQYTFLAIELKTPARRNEKYGGLSQEQLEFIDAANRGGGSAHVCFGADEAINIFDSYMQLENRFRVESQVPWKHS